MPQLERSPLLHLGFQALDAFQAEQGRLPEPGNAVDAAAVLAAAKQINESASDKVGESDGWRCNAWLVDSGFSAAVPPPSHIQ